MTKVQSWVVKRVLDGEDISEFSWTIYFLLDLKVVYIITYAYITIINLISSTANNEASSDVDSMMPFNVTPEIGSVEIRSISNAILWNCRRQSVTKHYYRFLYWMLIVALGGALIAYLVTKCIALFSVSCVCKTYRRPWVVSDYGLKKLWQIAVLELLKEKAELWSQSQQQPATGNEKISEGNNEQSQSDNVTHGTQLQVAVADIESKTDVENARTNSSDVSHHGISLVVETHEEVQASIDEVDRPSVRNETNMVQPIQIDNSTSISNKSDSSKLELKDYQSLLSENVTNSVFKNLGQCSRCINCCRQIIPGFVLFLSIIMMAILYLSYDIHPMECIVHPEDHVVTYNATTGEVVLEFSIQLQNLQSTAGFIVIVLNMILLCLAYLFYLLSKRVIEDIKSLAKFRIDKKTKQLGLLSHNKMIADTKL